MSKNQKSQHKPLYFNEILFLWLYSGKQSYKQSDIIMKQKPIISLVNRKVGRFSIEGRSTLLIDSGIGLLSIAGAIHQAYPEIKLFAISDHKGFPWGPREVNDLIERCLKLTKKGLAITKAESIVVACNTASTVVMEALRDYYDIPVIGVIPAIKPAAQMTKKGVIGVLATEGTVDRPYINQLIDDFAADCNVVKVGSPDLAQIAEDKLQEKSLDYGAIAKNLMAFEQYGADIVALGCTHYPLLVSELEAMAESEIKFLDPGPAVARQLARRLAEFPPQMQTKQTSCLYYTGTSYQISPEKLKPFGFDRIEPL